MNKSTSLYLDLLRVIAAFGVLLVHANLQWISNSLFLRPELGHRLVMVFFVLSGFLIAFTVDKKNKGPQIYLVDRFSRLYSVVLPALLFTFLIDFVGKKIHPDFYVDKINADHQFMRFFVNFAYLQQVWTLCTKPSTNTPFWSISYEFWYYMMFWVLCYLKGFKRYLGIVVLALIVGLKILLLLPVWFLGVLAYRLSGKVIISAKQARVVFVLTLLAGISLTFFKDINFLEHRFPYGKAPLYFSSQFLFDWGYGTVIALNIWSFSASAFIAEISPMLEKPIKYLSSITFTLYLFHLPMLDFVAATVPYDRTSYLQIIPILVGIVFVVSLFAIITEKQRWRFKQLIEKIFNVFAH
jgi:peptidoglycan/LPS O-acetylase OafA/YrhL